MNRHERRRQTVINRHTRFMQEYVEHLHQLADRIGKPGVVHTACYHDDWCGIYDHEHGGLQQCTCKPMVRYFEEHGPVMIDKIKPHPLEPMAWKAFAERDHQDSTSLGYFLAGAVVTGGNHAYSKVARDVLTYMEAQGKLVRDRQGWWRPDGDRNERAGQSSQ